MDVDEYETLPETSSVLVHMSAGAAAGVMEHCVMYPFDSVKTRLQILKPCPEAHYRSVGEAFYKMVRYEGIFRPVRGMSAVVVGAGPAHALYFSCYEKSKEILGNSFLGKNNPISHCAAGGIATILHDGIMNPTEVIKQRMQVYNSPYKSCTDCMVTTYRNEGLRAFYRSYTTQLTMNIPFQCIHFMIYEFMQQITNKERTYSPLAHMTSGGVAGGIAAAITTPLDVCKTLLNTQEGIDVNKGNSSRIQGMRNAIRKVHKSCGIPGFFRGMQARVIAQTPATAISWSVYEFFKYFLTKNENFQGVSNSSILMDKAKPVQSFPAPRTIVAASSST
ncbi:Mitoferrin-1 [Nymphon striatum]|nr:Mitoferrin-1 [Nymphon striatum]